MRVGGTGVGVGGTGVGVGRTGVGVGGFGVGVGGIGVGVGGTGVALGGTGVGWTVAGLQPPKISALRMSTNPKVDSLLFISCLFFLFFGTGHFHQASRILSRMARMSFCHAHVSLTAKLPPKSIPKGAPTWHRDVGGRCLFQPQARQSSARASHRPRSGPLCSG